MVTTVVPNEELLAWLTHASHLQTALAIERIESYGMPVGREVFETVLWAGRFWERWLASGGGPVVWVPRREVKLALCGSARATDATIRQALIDRYGPGKTAAIGTKKAPGPLYGVHGDAWAALAVLETAREAHGGA